MPELRPYQIEDVNFLQQHNNMGCFNEQRTGKTPTTLIAMQQKGCKKILIVCPASAIYQWKEEFELWLNNPCVVANGTIKQKLKAIENWTHGLVISIDSFKTTAKSDGMIDEILVCKPDGMILDEAHRIGNYTSKNAKAAFRCFRIPNRIAATGTPAPSKQENIWSILHFLDPIKYKGFYSFRDKYFETISMGNYVDIRGFKKGMKEKLQFELAEIATQRKRKEVMSWLPEKDYQKIYLEPTKEQNKYLSDLMEYFETEHIVTQGVLDRLIRYRQICLDPQILKLKGNSPKTDWIVSYLKDYPDKPVIVFSKFKTYLKQLAIELNKYKISKGVITGDVNTVVRNKLKLDFQSGKINLLLIQIDAGKEALTLDRAETMIFTDKYPPIGDIKQAEDRFVATTEDRANKPHTIYELILKGTYDENIYKMLSQQASEVDVINDFKNQLERRKQ